MDASSAWVTSLMWCEEFSIPHSTAPDAGGQTLLAVHRRAVGRRPLSVYDELTGTRPFTSNSATKDAR
ncbi:hypothetical protein ACFV3E_46040 [Streptomyces sp. NPDC059718]